MLTTRSRLTVPLLLAAAVLLCASQAAAQARVPTHVACVGDSITYGYNASSASASYPSVMQGLFGSSVQVMNFGKNSTTMLTTGDLPYQNQTQYTAATTFVSGAGASAVVDVIIMLGTNDSKPENWTTSTGTRAQQYVTDCSAMVDHFTSLPTHPMVFLALPPRAFTNAYGIDGTVIHDQILPLIRQVATAKGMPIIDVDTPTAGLSSLFPDGVHPNDTGYAMVAQIMHDGLLSATDAGSGGAAGRGGAGSGGSGQGGAKGSGGIGGGGGRRGAGGVTATGGRVGSGGVTASGGFQGSTGGASATGGHVGGSGGVAGSGGTQGSTGGAAASGGHTGGTVGTASGGTASGGVKASSGGVQGGSGGSPMGSGGTPGSDANDADAGGGVSTMKSGCSYGSSGHESGSVLLLTAIAYLVRRRRVS